MKYIRRKIKKNNRNLFKSTKFVELSLLVVLLMIVKVIFSQNAYATPVNSIWEVRSIDTMKTSRDLARVKLYDYSYDKKIDEQVKVVKDIGANYITIDTPYDDEFLPYLKRWVNSARKNNLKIWYRGSFSGYEGWFDYSKNVSPNELLIKTQQFIESHTDLFKDGDIFDPCPECENAGHWPQPEKNAEYNLFLQEKNIVLSNSFKKIGKNVIYNFNSVIGGRAKEILTQDTLDKLGHVATLDHYASNAISYKNYIEYFSKHNASVVISEFGAPIPDIHGDMDEEEQASFIKNVLDVLYKEKDYVKGVNYWVLNDGTTALINDDFTQKPVSQILKNYYRPATVKGQIKNPLGDALANIEVQTIDGFNKTNTDKNGYYQITVPAGKIDIVVGGDNYSFISFNENLKNNQILNKQITLNPYKTGFIYNVRFKLKQIFKF